jgi:hypothetical protein
MLKEEAMTKSEWLNASDPSPMLSFLKATGGARDRRLRLLACAAVRKGAWSLLTDERSREAVEARERYEEGLLSATELKGPQLEAWRVLAAVCDAKSPVVDAVRAAAEAAGQPGPSVAMRIRVAEDQSVWWRETERMWAYETEHWTERVLQYAARAATGAMEGLAWTGERARQADLVRCIFGLRPEKSLRIDAGWLSWNAGTVVKLARSIYDEGRWDEMGVLADALMEAGCQDETILEHCRKGLHARGCHVVDGLLGRC